MTTLHRFDLDRLPAMPWKNGGGRTREIACWPPGTGLDHFGWRCSVASIESDGPFSAFPGVDRQILLLAGDGVQLQGEGLDHRLDVPLQPFAFAGEAVLGCTRLGGASTDFNVMARRGRFRAKVTVHAQAARLAGSPHGLLLAVAGTWR
ncbi:HutD/Ves family protein, partial [Pseudacidovorax intermedius]